jgi:poly(3-hydroxyalkanoate) synthetase
VRLDAISCPIAMLAGATDHITPPAQVFALADHVATRPADMLARTTTGGHLGLFMGNEALREHWPFVMAAVLEHSKAPVDPARARRKGQAATKRARAIPAP